MPIELREPDGSIVPHVLLAFTQIIALVSPQFPFRRHLFTAILVALFAASRVRPHFSNDPAVVQPFILGWSTFLSTMEKIMFSGEEGPEHHFWRIDRPAHEAEHMGAFGPMKLKWAAAMLFNMRGVRWNYEVKNVPPLPKSTKARYLVKQVAYLLYYVMMADIVSQIWFQMFFAAGAYDTKYLSLRNGGPLRSFVARLTFGMMPYYMIQIQYVVFAIISVGLGFSKKEDWPPYFGKISHVTTLRDFWGKYWHQTLRRPLLAFPQALVDALGIKRGSTLSAYTQLWLAFAISGLMHAQSIFMLPCPVNITFDERLDGVVVFFFLHAAAITMEDFVQWSLRQIGVTFTGRSVVRTLIGYAWVTAFFWFSLPQIGDVLLRIRFGEQPLFTASPNGAWIKNLVDAL